MTEKNLSVITTADGSHSLLNKDLNEPYHSVHGAVQESLHVFIKAGLEYQFMKTQPSALSLFEVGFGTGLNALLASQAARRLGVAVDYTATEAYPVDSGLALSLNYGAVTGDPELFRQIHAAEWGCPVSITSQFILRKVNARIQELDPAPADVVFFDAFAPSKQPEMWTPPILERVCKALNPGGVFVTYCAKGQLKRDLRALGLTVETLPGPPGKKEMVRAARPRESS
jgi:tRNA U34 5-methylaminomethyl-2-thiouridine-forming methyltransferase MnmC